MYNKVMLINPPSKTYRKVEENLGLAYLKSYMNKNGILTDVIDGFLCNLSNEEILDQIKANSECKIVGISPYIDSLENTKTLAGKIKQFNKDIVIVLGGHLASFSSEDLIKDKNIDYIVKGEGERTFVELSKAIIDNQEYERKSSIAGICFMDKKNIVTTQKRELIENLDELPFPDRKYSAIAKGKGALTHISGSRGCYGRCSFCSINSFYKTGEGKSWRGRSVINIVDEIETIYNKNSSNIFKFVDDSFFGPGSDGKKRGLDFADELEKRGIKIKFRISIRANDVDYDVLKRLKDVGLYSVSIGIESAVPRALKTFEKGISVQQNIHALKVLKELGIITLMGFIGFDPYTTIEETEKNLEFLKEMDFTFTDIISKPLFVHAQDPITEKLLKENRINGRIYPNYTYTIDDERTQRLLEYLKKWNTFNKEIYYEISDIITAPRITTPEQEKKIIEIYREIRKIDLYVYERVLSMIKSDIDDKKILTDIENLKDYFGPQIHLLYESFLSLIK